jgi:hypothetical protein
MRSGGWRPAATPDAASCAACVHACVHPARARAVVCCRPSGRCAPWPCRSPLTAPRRSASPTAARRWRSTSPTTSCPTSRSSAWRAAATGTRCWRRWAPASRSTASTWPRRRRRTRTGRCTACSRSPPRTGGSCHGCVCARVVRWLRARERACVVWACAPALARLLHGPAHGAAASNRAPAHAGQVG